MKSWYVLGAIIAYYLYTRTPQVELAVAQNAQNTPGGGVELINVADSLTSTIDPAAVDPYVVPTVRFSTGVSN